MSEIITVESFENEKFHKINLRFSGKPSEEQRTELKNAGWRYTTLNGGSWYPHTSEAKAHDVYFAEQFKEKYYPQEKKSTKDFLNKMVDNITDYELPNASVQNISDAIENSLVQENTQTIQLKTLIADLQKQIKLQQEKIEKLENELASRDDENLSDFYAQQEQEEIDNEAEWERENTLTDEEENEIIENSQPNITKPVLKDINGNVVTPADILATERNENQVSEISGEQVWNTLHEIAEMEAAEDEPQAEKEVLQESQKQNDEDLIVSPKELALAKSVLPTTQYVSTLRFSQGEERQFFVSKIKEIANAVENAPKLYTTDGMEQHPIVLRYFHPSGTETLVTEIGKDGEAFGFQCLNGNYEMAEWGYIDLNETKNIRGMEVDYHVEKGMTVERHLYKENHERFPQYAEFADVEEGAIHRSSNEVLATKKEKTPFDVAKETGNDIDAIVEARKQELLSHVKFYVTEYAEFAAYPDTENMPLEDVIARVREQNEIAIRFSDNGWHTSFSVGIEIDGERFGNDIAVYNPRTGDFDNLIYEANSKFRTYGGVAVQAVAEEIKRQNKKFSSEPKMPCNFNPADFGLEEKGLIEAENGVMMTPAELFAWNKEQEMQQEQDAELDELAEGKAFALKSDWFIYTEEFISKFGDWEKANRIEKVKDSDVIHSDGKVIIDGEDYTNRIVEARKNKDLHSLKLFAKQIGSKQKGIYTNKDKNIDVQLSMRNISEISSHHLVQNGHLEAMTKIDEIIKKAIWIDDVKNEDKATNSNIEKYSYFVSGLNINGIDYTVKSVIGTDKDGNHYYDQRLSEIEKGKLVEILTQRMSRENSTVSLAERYDKRLIQICQVPQMPYLEMKYGEWLPTIETAKKVMEGTLFVEKDENGVQILHDTEKGIVIGQKLSDFFKNDKNVQSTEKLNAESTQIATEAEPTRVGSKTKSEIDTMTNPWFASLSDEDKTVVLLDMRTNPDFIGEYQDDLNKRNIKFNLNDRPPKEWLLARINHRNYNGEYSYFNENNEGQKRHYEELIERLTTGERKNTHFDLYSEEFISKFGDWEKANRLEKLKNSNPIVITGEEIPFSEDLKEYKKNAISYGKSLRGEYINTDSDVSILLTTNKKNGGIYEILEHDYKDIEHLQSIAAIPQIIEKSIYVSSQYNEDVQKHPNIKSYDYYLCGLKISGEDYTVKAVISNTVDGQRYYDHKLTDIEKGLLLDKLSQLMNLEKSEQSLKNYSVPNSSVSISTQTPESERYLLKDKRLYQICQVPQMPYLEMKYGEWLPTIETAKKVMEGTLFVEKDENGVQILHDTEKGIVIGQKLSDFFKNDKNVQSTEKLNAESTQIATEAEPSRDGSKTKSEIKNIREQCREILKKPDSEITEADKEILAQYEGAGGLNVENRTNAGILNEFYTPNNLVQKVWEIVDAYAPNAKTVLEPSAGVGKFANNRPNNKFTMHELDETSARINEILHPEANIIQGAYQKQFFDEGERFRKTDYEQPKYDVVIGNPPYGAYNDKYKGLGEGKEFDRYEEYFISKGLDALKDENSIMAFVVPSGFLNTASDKQKELIASKGRLIDAYRLPAGTFSTTEVGTDIIIMQNWASVKKDFQQRQENEPNVDWNKQLEDVMTTEKNRLSDNYYFKLHPEKILGEVKTRTNRFGKEEEYVAVHEGLTVQDELNKISVGLPKVNQKKPELKTYHILKEEDVRNLEVISDEEFEDIVDSIILNDYKNIPNSIRLPNLNEQLAEKLGLEKDSAFILKKNATHIRPDRKGGYGQAFDTEEYRKIPEVLRKAEFAVVDTIFQNFQIVFDDENDGTKINKLVFNKDELGNYLVTLGKVDRESAFSEKRNTVVAVGVAPTIQTLRTSASSTALRASTTTVDANISQTENLSNDRTTEKETNKNEFFVVTESVTFPCNFAFPANLKGKNHNEHLTYAANFVNNLNQNFNFGDECETEIFTDENGEDFNVNFTLQVPADVSYPKEETQKWKDNIVNRIYELYGNNNAQVVFDADNSITKTFDSEENALEYVKIKDVKTFDMLTNEQQEEVLSGYRSSDDPLMLDKWQNELQNFIIQHNIEDKERIAEITDVELNPPSDEWIENYIKENNVNFNTEYWNDIFAENEAKIKASQNIATNYVLEKLKAAGIEVITDKEEFERILSRENVLQKMQGTLSEDEQNRYFQFNEEDTQKFIAQVNDWQKDNTNMYKMVIVGNVPPVMKILGIKENLIEVQQSTLDKMVRDNPLYPNDLQGHKLSVDDIYAIPSQLADPVMVFKSRTRADSFVFFTERKDSNNNSILIPMAVNKRKGRIVINEITSMYGKDNEVDFVKTNFDEDNLIYLDKARSNEWVENQLEKEKSSNGERFTKVQFLGQRFTDIETYNVNILTKERLVNFISADSRSKPIQKMTDIEKAPAEVVTLYMRVSKSASAYANNIILKSKFVNNLDLFLYAQNGETYGFTFENKIYLNPEIMNSNVAVHEYTHLWDEYTKRTNPELWNKGKNILKNTYLWDEIKNSSDYADIADNEDLLASEVHSRICGQIAQSVLERIAKENGEITKDAVIDWDKEVQNYIEENFSGERYRSDGTRIETKGYGSFGVIVDVNAIRSWFSRPIKDLMNGSNISVETNENSNNLTESNNNLDSLIEEEKRKVQQKIAELKEEFNNADYPTNEIDEANQREYISRLENLTDEDFRNIVQWKQDTKKDAAEAHKTVVEHYEEVRRKENEVQAGELFSAAESKTVITVKNNETGRETAIQPSGNLLKNVMKLGRLKNLTEANLAVEKINAAGLEIVSTESRIILYDDEKFYDFNDVSSWWNYEKQSFEYDFDSRNLNSWDFKKFVDGNFKITRQMQDFLKIENKENSTEKVSENSIAPESSDEPLQQKIKKPKTSRTKKEKWNIEKSKGEVMTSEEFSRLYGKDFDEREFPIWKATDWQGNIDTTKLSVADLDYMEHSGNYIQKDVGVFTHKLLFTTGDIYSKLAEQEKLRQYMVNKSNFEMAEVFKKNITLLEFVKKEPLKIENIHFGLKTTLAEEFTIGHIDADGNVVELNLQESFILWCQNTSLSEQRWRGDIDFATANISREELGEEVYFRDIIDYIDGTPVKAERTTWWDKHNLDEDGIDALKAERKKEADLKRQARSDVANRLFDRYLHEGLSADDVARLSAEYNRKFNSYIIPDYSKLPLFVDGMSAYKGESKFKLYDQQIKGISFLCNKGNGLLAYDVGVGKTAAGIVATENQIQSGRSKRPLIVVPNQVYSKWYTDIKQLFPNRQVNDLYNFNKESVGKYIDKENPHKLNIPENSISLCTYEALKNITFTDESCQTTLFSDFSNLLSADFDGSERENAESADKISGIIGAASHVKDSNYFFFEECGFDNLTVDEAHNFKNLWVVPRPKKKGSSNEYAGIPSGKPSARALKMYGMTQLVQEKNDNRNVFMLTATPFTNSPTEVYSMLSYIGRERLHEAGLSSLRSFFDEFAQTKQELGVTSTGNIDTKQVMKNWKELPALQSILTEFIDKVDGEEAGIIRPNKFTHVKPLDMSELQKQMREIDEERMAEIKDGNSAAIIVAMNNMRLSCVAPALANPAMYPDVELPPLEQLVETSPKLKFVCDAIIDMYKDNPEKGQFMYVPLGKNSHGIIKDYLIRHGIPKDAVEIINGEINNTPERKEKITAKFNDEKNKCKIIIGGRNTAEGIDLNGNSFVMYNCSLGWNPSETIQAEGRIWRQGNLQGNVHVVYPVMNDSIDSVLYQKHDEKRSRINELWNYKGDSLNVEDINPEDLKLDLIKDPAKKAKLILQDETKEVRAELSKINLKIRSFDEIIEKRKQNTFDFDNEKEMVRHYESMIQGYKEREMEVPEWVKNCLKDEKRKYAKAENAKDTIEGKLAALNLVTDEDISNYIRELNTQRHACEDKIKNIEKDLPQIMERLKTEQLEQKLMEYPVDKQREILEADILNNLRPMKEVEYEIKTMRHEAMLAEKLKAGEITQEEHDLYKSAGYKKYEKWLDGEIESLTDESIKEEKETKVFQTVVESVVQKDDRHAQQKQERTVVGENEVQFDVKQTVESIPAQNKIEKSFEQQSLWQEGDLFFELDDQDVLVKSTEKEYRTTERIPENQLFNFGNDDIYLTPEQLTKSEQKRDEIVIPVLNGKMSGMYKAFNDFAKHGVFDVIGTKVELSDDGKISQEGWQQLHSAMNIYRSKEFETFRYVLIDKHTGEINEQLEISSFMPNFCRTSLPDASTIKQVISRAEETNSLVVAVHNHPSGNIKESIEDIKATECLSKIMTNSNGENIFAGHIILDHDSFNLFTQKTGWNSKIDLENVGKDDVLINKNFAYMNDKAATPAQLEKVAIKINDKNNWNDDFVPVVFANSENDVTGIKLYDRSFFDKSSMEIRNTLQFHGLEAGAVRAFPVITQALRDKLNGADRILLEKRMEDLVNKNAFTDAVVVDSMRVTTIVEKTDIKPGFAFTDVYSPAKTKVNATWETKINPELFKESEHEQKKEEIRPKKMKISTGMEY